MKRQLQVNRPFSASWNIEASAVDVGLDVPTAGTPRALGTVVAGRADPTTVDRLVTAVERARYARPGTEVADERDAARRVVAQVTGSAPRAQRWAARVLPRSLWRRR